MRVECEKASVLISIILSRKGHNRESSYLYALMR
jgi:hypothetical protein